MDINVNGAMVYWIPKAVNRDSLVNAFNTTADEVRPAIPQNRAQLPCLRDALVHLYKGPQTLIRPLYTGKDGYVVVREERDEGGNKYDQQTLYWLDSGIWHQIKDSGNPAAVAPWDVMTAWNDQLAACTGDQITVMLQRYLREKCQGISLRPHGSMYWLPDAYQQRWQDMAQTMEDYVQPASYETDKTEFRQITTVMDGNAVVAFGASLKEEVDELEATIRQQIADPNTGRLALDRRAADAVKLSEKVKEYETALGASLTNLSGTLTTLQQEAAKASVIASVRKDIATSSAALPDTPTKPTQTTPIIPADTKLEDLKFPWED